MSPSILRKTWSNAKQVPEQIRCGASLAEDQGCETRNETLGTAVPAFSFSLKMLVQSPYPVDALGVLGGPVGGFRQELISVEMNRNHGPATHGGRKHTQHSATAAHTHVLGKSDFRRHD